MNQDNHTRKKSIARRVKEFRKQAGYTSYETFANEKGFPRKNYWRIENGNNFTINTLLKITNIHNITLEEFFKGIK